MIEVVGVEPLEPFWLRLRLSNGDVVEREISNLLDGRVFEPIRERREVFEAAYVEGGTVAWPGNADIAPETLIWDGPEPSEEGARPEARLRLRPAASRLRRYVTWSEDDLDELSEGLDYQRRVDGDVWR